MSLYNALQNVKDFDTLLNLFTDELGWDVDRDADPEAFTFEWEADDINPSESSTRRLSSGVIRQPRTFPRVKGQPWGIFFIEFTDRNLYRTVLGQVLRKLVLERRGAAADRSAWRRENLLFICATKNYERFTLAHFKGRRVDRAVLAMFGWEKGDTHARTLCEYNLPALRSPRYPNDSEGWLNGWRAAFDIEAFADKFFDDYREVFAKVEAEVKKSIRKDEDRRLFTERLFNRLMFVYFIQKKGWLTFEGNTNYLRALFDKAEATREDFLSDRLHWLFFHGLSNAGESGGAHTNAALTERRGDVPHLSCGLFDVEDDYDMKGAVKLPNISFAQILELFERYDFTVTESTPLDVQGAVDPEMLGKVFEGLVTGRHESGSYYTPRSIVSFMCREALKRYLAQATGATPESVSKFVDDEDGGELKDAEVTLEALRRVRVCDPACGSGAYLLGMLQELMRLHGALRESRRLDDNTVYDRKRSVIEKNLYGVDKDRFAVRIARLRLWLSLAIESNSPRPLPNLDFKIGCGDSLAAPPPSGKDQPLERGLARPGGVNGNAGPAFDWAAEFAEVFSGGAGGFDIIVANPPYVRQGTLGRDYKEKRLKAVYPDVYAGLADLYVYFYARAHQLLKRGGVGCFISSNKWLRQDYGEKLRRAMLDKQAFHLVADFGELPVFRSVIAYTEISLWQKRERGDCATSWAVVTDLQACYDEGIREHILRIAETVPSSQFGGSKSRLVSPRLSNRVALMESNGQPIGELASGIFVGLQTSADKIYILDYVKGLSGKRVLLHSKATGEDHEFETAMVKPLLSGTGVKRYEEPAPAQFIIFPYRVFQGRATLFSTAELRQGFPLTYEYLRLNKRSLEGRENGKMRGPCWHGYIYLKNMARQETIKLCVPRLVSRIKTTFDEDGKFYLDNVDVGGVTLKDAGRDSYLYTMAVLNSELLTWYLRQISTPFRGGFFSCNKQYLSRLPIPDAPTAERAAIAKLAGQTQSLRGKRRERVKRFLRDAGFSPARFNSRDPLERPWAMSAEEFNRRARNAPTQLFKDARDETFSLTESITVVEREIDGRVAALYGVA